MLRRFSLWLALFSVLLLASGCSDVTSASQPSILLSTGSVQFSSVAIGNSQTQTVLVQNTGDGALRISSAVIETDSGFVTLEPFEAGSIAPGERTSLRLTYAPTTYRRTSGVLAIRSNDPAKRVVQLPVQAAPSLPNLLGAPDPLEFGVVQLDSTQTSTLRIFNAGFANARICEVVITGDAEMTANIDEALAARGDTPGQPFEIGSTAALGDESPLTWLDIDVTYAPTSPGVAQSEVLVRYDIQDYGTDGCTVKEASLDAERATWELARFRINGRADDSLLSVSPNPVDFGERPVGGTARQSVTISNVGGLPLTLTSLAIAPGSDPAFDIDDLGAPTLPIRIGADEVVSVVLTYRPTAIGVPQAGVLEVGYNQANGQAAAPAQVGLAGVGAAVVCPIAVAKGFILNDPQNRRSDEIDWAEPSGSNLLILDATESYDPDGIIGSYRWSVVPGATPPGAINGLEPWGSDPLNPAYQQYTIYFAGEYRFRLEVVDGDGVPGCDVADVTVRAYPTRAIAVELEWHTPDDPNEGDNEGADLDLHLLKMNAPWFSQTNDTYWEVPEPDWAPETPRLDFDDTNGRGPETISLPNPVDCQWYAVGAHYYREAFGTSYATVRIFINGALQAEYPNRRLSSGEDFWDVARIHWNGGVATIYEVDEVTPGFNISDQVSPVLPPAAASSGLCSRSP
jgi:hypothetical protein